MKQSKISAPFTLSRTFLLLFFRVFLGAIVILFSLISCAGDPEPTVEVPEPEPETIPEPKKEPAMMDWAGTTWIIPDPPDTKPKNTPDYRGFHLGLDGRLLLVNLDSATGNTWSAEGNRLQMDLLGGTPNIPIEGNFLAFAVDEETTERDSPLQKIRLVPANAPDSEGLILQRAEVHKDLVFNHWVPMSLKGSETVHWPANREIHLMLLSDGNGGLGVLGYGGENRFHGPVNVGKEEFIVGALAMTKKIGLASEFENLYVAHIDAVNRYVQVRDELYLYENTLFLVSFTANIFD